MLKRGVAWAVCAAMALTGVWLATPVAQAAEVNVIPDSGLRQCIADRMHYWGVGYSPSSPEYNTEAQSISQADLDSLAQATTRSYEIFCTGVGSLSGLENLRDSDLYSLTLYDSTVSDVSPLANMTNLESLSLNDNQISDLTPLANMTWLTHLVLGGNQIGDVSALKNLTNLEYVILDNNQISDVTALKNLTKLEYLYLGANQISDVSALKNLTNLEYLDLVDNQISDVKPLASLTNLQMLHLSNNHIKDLSPLAGIPATASFNGNYTLSGQTLTSSAKSGSTVSLPSVTDLSWDDPVSWSVVKGNASINASKGTVTYKSPGLVMLQWHGSHRSGSIFAESAESCAASGGVWLGQSGGDSPCGWYVFNGTVIVSACQNFTDVPASNTFASSICWVSSTGITKGTGDGSTYSPSNPVTRGSMAAFLYRLAGSPKWDPPKKSPFVDVKTTDTFYHSITWLYDQKVTVGTTIKGKLYYQPTNAVNRGSMAAFLYRLSGSPEWSAPTKSPFTDVKKTHLFYSSITWLADQKITVGTTVKGKLVYQPSNPVNRGSMAAFMSRLSKTQFQCTNYKTAVGC